MSFRIAIIVLALAISSTNIARDKESYCSWDGTVTEDFLDGVDANLLGARSQEANDIIADSLPIPMLLDLRNANNEELLVQPNYITWYDNDLRAPLWVAYHLTKEDVDDGVKREDSFRSDPRLEYWERADCADYKEGIFDQGHMVPSADMKRSREAMASTFLMSNMTPQFCQFNRGPWQVLEGLTRKWAEIYEEVWVITGALFDRYGDDRRDADQTAWRMSGKRGMRVAIPSHQYKIIVRKEDGKLISLAFLLPNSDNTISNNEMNAYLTSNITTLENISSRSEIGLDESFIANQESTLWSFPGKLPKSLAYNCEDNYPEY